MISDRIAELREWLLADNVKAFLRVIREGESRQDDLAYQIRYAGIGKKPEVFDDLSDHPRIYEPTLGGLKSSAAGAYQATYSTWEDFLKDLGPFDFSKESQDLFAVWCLNRAKAIPAILEGRFEEACRLCASTWTSLPGGKEENAATKRARETFLKWGGKLAPIKAPNPIAQSFTEKSTVAPIVLPLLQAAASLIPQLGSLFADSETAKRNVAAGTVVADTLVKATQSVNLQEAVERIQSDPQALQTAKEAVASVWPSITESGGGGIAEARKAAADPAALPPWKNAAVWITAFLLPLIYGAGYAVLYTDRFSDDLKTVVVTAIFAGLLGSITGFFLGSSLGSQKKDALIR